MLVRVCDDACSGSFFGSVVLGRGDGSGPRGRGHRGLRGESWHEPGAALLGLPAVGMGLVFMCIAGFIFCLLATVAVLDFKCGRSLARRKNSTHCYVMAALSCVNVPFGTLLGVFTLVVLSRPTVKELFNDGCGV